MRKKKKKKKGALRQQHSVWVTRKQPNKPTPFWGGFPPLLCSPFLYLMDKFNEHTCRICLPLPSNGMEIEHGRGVGGKQEVKGTKSTREGKRERELERGESRKGDLINRWGEVGERERNFRT